mgnify:CR=1 FL=1
MLGASALFAFAQWMERTAVDWLGLEETGSVFLTALAWAVRAAPSAIMAGSLLVHLGNRTVKLDPLRVRGWFAVA